MFFITNALASESVSSGGITSAITSFAPIILIIAVFYFLILRPQQKKMKEHQILLKSLSKGDTVSFAAGLIGSIAKSDDSQILVIEISDGIKIKARRDSVTEVIKEMNLPKEEDSQKKPIPKKAKKQSVQDQNK